MAESHDEAAPVRQYKDHNFVVVDEHLSFVAERLAGFAVVETHAAGSTRFLHVDAPLAAALGVDETKLLFLPVKDAYPRADADVLQRLEDAVVSGADFAEVMPGGESGLELLVVACSASEPASHARATKAAERPLGSAGSDLQEALRQGSSVSQDDEAALPVESRELTVIAHGAAKRLLRPNVDASGPARVLRLLATWAACHALVDTSTPDGTILSASAPLAEELGTSAEALLGTGFAALAGPGTSRKALRALTEMLGGRSSGSGGDAGARPTQPLSILLYRSGGEPLEAMVWVLPVQSIALGAPNVAAVCVANVTAARCKRVDRITLGRTLGAGAFGRVHIGQLAGAPELVAVKVMDTHQFRNIQDIDAVGNELGVMQTLRHPNIIEMIDVIFRDGKFYIILECAGGGDLRDYIVAAGRLPERECQRLFQQCVAALAFCQRRHVCHRDLKPENILLDAAKNVKIADFGLASVVAPGEAFARYCGTPAFSAPEAFGGAEYDGGPADVWSLGVVLYECLTGRLPFTGGGGGVRALKAQLHSGKYPPLPASLSAQTRHVVASMLVVDPHDRISLDELCNHPWYLAPPDAAGAAAAPAAAPRRVRLAPECDAPTRGDASDEGGGGASHALASFASSAGSASGRLRKLHSSVTVDFSAAADDDEEDFLSSALQQYLAKDGDERKTASGALEGGGVGGAAAAAAKRATSTRFASGTMERSKSATRAAAQARSAPGEAPRKGGAAAAASARPRLASAAGGEDAAGADARARRKSGAQGGATIAAVRGSGK